jgi:hypothetical protein
MTIRATRQPRGTSGAPPMNIWAHMSDSCPSPDIFIGDMLPMNVTRYIRRFDVTDEYIVTFVGTDE